MARKTDGIAFSNRSLFVHESVMMAALFLDAADWNVVRAEVLSKNLLQSRTASNAERLCREFISRLKTLHLSELRLLFDGTPLEQGYILWIAICRRYKLIADFAVEVLRERYLSLKTHVKHEEFDSFFNRQAEWHPGLEKISPSTRSKQRQMLFKILREAELLDANHRIIPAMLSQRLVDVICDNDRSALLWFPVFETELRTQPR